MVNFCLNDLLFAVSGALDYVEGQLLGVTTHHAKRVAYLASQMGKLLGAEHGTLVELAGCAVLHDNALTEYIQSEYRRGVDVLVEKDRITLAAHCVSGEKNIRKMPFSCPEVHDCVLLHHERADGRGPFGKTAAETPLFARLIHLADAVDAKFDLDDVTDEKYAAIRNHLEQGTGSLFDPEMTKAFFGAFPGASRAMLKGAVIDELLRDSLPPVRMEMSSRELIDLAAVFAKIIDYKSPFTCAHSSGIAEKARAMGVYYGWDSDTQAKLYLAGALHDIGKLTVSNDLLEKPGKLTPGEYRDVQSHAYETYRILSTISGLEDVASWASLHHEKLDGSGYPFGMTAKDLGPKERLMACLDIYQALVEARPYKQGMPHGKAMQILRSMAQEGKLDAAITEDIGACFAGTTQQESAFSNA